MEHSESSTSRRLDRRRAMRLLAGSTGAVVAASAITSQPVIADSGSAPCRYNFTDSPVAAFRRANRSFFGIGFDLLSGSISGVGGSCPCGGGAVIEYAFAFSIPGGTSGATNGWITSATASTPVVGTLWPASGGSVNVAAAVRTTCDSPGLTEPAVRCGFSASVNLPVGPEAYDETTSIPISTTNGNSIPPLGLPACGPAPFAASFRAIGTVAMEPGLRQPVTEQEARKLVGERLPPTDAPASATPEADTPDRRSSGRSTETTTSTPTASSGTDTTTSTSTTPTSTTPPSTSRPSTSRPSTTAPPTSAPPTSPPPAARPPSTTTP